ncbi:hypothetical protein MAR_007590, partial [Mya arenaria]
MYQAKIITLLIEKEEYFLQLTEGISQLRGDLKSMLKKDEIEELIKNTVTSIFSKLEETMKKQIEIEITNKTKVLNDKITGLEFEKDHLKEELKTLEKKNSDMYTEMKSKIDRASETGLEALKLANYNEQYSRKNNIKVMNVKQAANETEPELIENVSKNLKSAADIDLNADNILAIHRIPSKQVRMDFQETKGTIAEKLPLSMRYIARLGAVSDTIRPRKEETVFNPRPPETSKVWQTVWFGIEPRSWCLFE